MKRWKDHGIGNALLCVLACSMLLTVGLGTASAQLPSTVGIGTHPVGGAYHASGSGVAALISEKTKIRAVAQPFGGPNAWMPLMQSGELEMGLLSGFDAATAYAGTFAYKTPCTKLRLVLSGNVASNSTFTVLKRSGITAVKQVKGKKIPTGFGGNQMFQQMITAMLVSVGLNWDDVNAVPVPDFISSIRMLREGRIDVGPTGSPTTPKAVELNTALGVNVLPFGDLQAADIANGVPEKYLDILDKLVPGTFPKVAKAGLGVLDKDTVLISYPVYLAASSDLSEEAVYVILKAIWENYKELQSAHAWLKQWKPETMAVERQPVPYHAGAVKWYKEKGVWTPAMEKRQEQLLHR